MNLIIGTYNQVHKMSGLWDDLVIVGFNQPDWESLYPINARNEPANMLTPRLACKLFHDGIYVLKKADENEKYYMDRLPEIVHKMFKKKQFRKQCLESGRRVVCRLALGLGFSPNCMAEEFFIYIVYVIMSAGKILASVLVIGNFCLYFLHYYVYI